MGELISLLERPKKEESLSDRFGLRLDEKLPTLLTDWSRKIFLTALLHNWERRYAHFLERLDMPGFDPGDLTAFDFATTISEISVRLAKYERARQS